MLDIIRIALSKRARIYVSISGGKDSQAMSRVLRNNHIPIEGFIHCDLGRTEWPESLEMCHKIANRYQRPFYILRRSDGIDLLQHWINKLKKHKGTGIPFWSSK